mmetsp:Transcript_47797/g.77564  ORF Transcript_47797/g.77564 Transcript_47797/m.77564 type:complete len:112 (-) Transcript_47797:23-358(-)
MPWAQLSGLSLFSSPPTSAPTRPTSTLRRSSVVLLWVFATPCVRRLWLQWSHLRQLQARLHGLPQPPQEQQPSSKARRTPMAEQRPGHRPATIALNEDLGEALFVAMALSS